jgi:uncharacterized repeat protein (TIGR02543 family)
MKRISFLTLLSMLLLSFFVNVSATSFSDNHNDNTTTGWTSYDSRTWSESNGSMRPAGGNPARGILINNTTCAANGTLEVRMTADQWNGSHGGVIFRYSSTSSFYFVAVLPGNQYSSTIKFCENNFNVNSGITVAQNFTTGTTFTLRVVLNGSTFQFYIDGVLQGQITDNSNTSGRVGYGHDADWNTYTSYDNITWTESNPEQYSITYSGNGNTSGTVPVDANRYTSGAIATVLAAGTLARSGYTFAGWNTAVNGSGTAFAAGASRTVTRSDTLFAQWTAAPTFSISYSGNGNTSGTAPVDANRYTSGAIATVLAAGTLARNGYTFAGWNTAANGSGTAFAAGMSITVTRSDTLFAQWTAAPTFSISYSGNGNTSGTAPVDANRYTSGAIATVLAAGTLARNGYTFAGWNTAANGSGTAFAAGASRTVTRSDTLFAQWAANVIPNSQKLAITARLYNADGTVVNGERNVTVRLYDSVTTGTLLYAENFLGVNNQEITITNGYFVVRLGEGVTTNNLRTVLTANNNLWIEIQVGSDILPRTPLTGAAYAIGN